MDNSKLVKAAQLDLLIELKRICESEGIEYFLVGGTLIGAIRHNGFIPWDDDIDVGMKRDQYEKFIIACKDNLDEHFQLYDWYADEKSPIPFLKLKVKGTHYTETLSATAGVNDEIFIDIFPYDNAPDEKLRRLVQKYRNIVIKKILLLRCGYGIEKNCNMIKLLAYHMLRVFSNIVSVEAWKAKYNKNATQYNGFGTQYLVSLGGSYKYERELKSRELLGSFMQHRFESNEFSVPENYDTFLREVYGDYMKFPPKEQQVSRHGILHVDMGSYEPKSSCQ